jgi:hypothetical protein
MPMMKVFTAKYTVYEADHSVYEERERVFSTMAKAIAFLADIMGEHFKDYEWLDENQKLSALEITEKCNESITVNPETGLVHMVYYPKHTMCGLMVHEMEVW